MLPNCLRLGPCLIEINPRMGGGPVRSIHHSVYGVDLANFVICAALNLHMIPELNQTVILTPFVILL